MKETIDDAMAAYFRAMVEKVPDRDYRPRRRCRFCPQAVKFAAAAAAVAVCFAVPRQDRRGAVSLGAQALLSDSSFATAAASFLLETTLQAGEYLNKE